MPYGSIENKIFMTYKKATRFLVAPFLLLLIGYVIFFAVLQNDMSGVLGEVWGAALCLSLISSFYIEYFFTKPKDAVINSLNSILLLLPLWQINQIVFWFFIIYSVLIFFTGVAFLSTRSRLKKNKYVEDVLSKAGKSIIIFPSIALVSQFNFRDFPLINLPEPYLFVAICLFVILLYTFSSEKFLKLLRNLPRKLWTFFTPLKIGEVKKKFTAKYYPS